MFGGCFKMTETLQWAHISCSMWIPELSFADDLVLHFITIIFLETSNFFFFFFF